MGRIVFLTDRSPAEALPALHSLGAEGFDVKAEPLSVDSLAHLPELAPEAILADAEDNPEHAFRLLAALAQARPAAPLVVLLARSDLERYAWAAVADDLVYAGVTAAELKVR